MTSLTCQFVNLSSRQLLKVRKPPKRTTEFALNGHTPQTRYKKNFMPAITYPGNLFSVTTSL